MTETLVLADPAPPRRPRIPRLLQQTAFRRYWSAQTVSLFGDQITVLAVPLLAVLAIGAGPAEMGYLTAASLLPNVFLSLPAGAWVDRYPRRRQVMIIADLGRAGLLLAVPLLWWADALNLPLLCVLAFLVGTLSVFFEVAHSSLFAALVRRADYVDANSLINGSRAMSYVAGPSIGGVLVQVLTAPVALVADVLTYLTSAVFLTRIRVTERPVQSGPGLGMFAGVRYVARSAVLRAILLGTTTLNLFNYMFAVLFVLYVTTELDVSPGVLGLIIGAGAFGGLLGAAITGPVSRRIGIGPALILGLVVFPAPLVLVPLAGGPRPLVLALLFAAEFVSALGVMVLDIAAGSVQIAATPETMLAVVSGFKRTVNYGIRPVGALIGGALGAAIEVRPALWIATLGALLGVFWVVFSPLRTMRNLPEQ
ncbi:Predicted arabinose efflux permease, MFS family [Micromonospora pattaloongensis]|uniref:Predicted arabinose efflux permease, MFS family n=1 Tax=Micromonospora pattaloongensis TaxID=405436 RepID=A0A1H3JL43_9ACTN|nr:MFS transporter [Micromonospora pattaloongensis]SDY40631.1 Predicted arabinose efflux permease, MFS family [Micromonospora pattaloongensis]